MDIGFQLLSVKQTGDVLIAQLPLSTLVGGELSQALKEDFQRIVQQAPRSIVLDLRQVEFIDGTFFSWLLMLLKSLEERSIRLTVQLSPRLAEVARILKMDQILELTGTEA